MAETDKERADFYKGIRAAIAYLHDYASGMNDPRAQERRRGGLSDEILIVDRESNAVIGIGRTALAAWENALSRIAASLHSGVTT